MLEKALRQLRRRLRVETKFSQQQPARKNIISHTVHCNPNSTTPISCRLVAKQLVQQVAHIDAGLLT